MDEEQVKTLLGEDYKEGITADEVSEIMKKRYETPSNNDELDKLNKELSDLKKQNSEYKKKIKENSSDAELKKLEDDEKEKRIAELEQQIEEQKIDASITKAKSKIMENKDMAGIEEKDIEELVKNISSVDTEKTSKIASSINELIKKAHEKGKSDAIKDSLGKMGSLKSGNNNENNKENLGKRLAKQSNIDTKKYESLYFKIN